MSETAFVDANCFVRLLSNNLPDQAEAVDLVLQSAEQGERRLVTNHMVFAELVWVLESFYKLRPDEVAARLTSLLNTPGLDVEQPELLVQALEYHANLGVDFIDGFNVAWMKARGIRAVYTFDEHFKRIPGVDMRRPQKEA